MRSPAHAARPGIHSLLLLVLLGLPGAAQAAGDAVQGKKVYQSNCVACHGTEADGNGPAAPALRPPPADFTSAAFWGGRDDAKVKAVIRSGKPGTPMMAYGQLSDTQLDDLIAFLRSKVQTEG